MGFAKVKRYENAGLCKVLHEDVSHVVVEYFDSPSDAGTFQKEVNLNEIIRKRVSPGMRAYYLTDESTWQVGVVTEDDGMGIQLRLANGKTLYEKYERIYIRCNRPIKDPTQFLGKLITENPKISESRRNFMASIVQQRRATEGISALLSSSIDLEEHQISVVRRVLKDPIQRYLLADEVGLGKTIEAGLLIRQAVLDLPRTHKIVILIPRPLVSQWREELMIRFGLGELLDDSLITLGHDADINDLEDALYGATMVVVDEVHHLTQFDNPEIKQKYSLLANSASKLERFLLLSATPVLRNEEGFLRILHLLDPLVYPLNGVEDLKRKIQLRKPLALLTSRIDPDDQISLHEDLLELEELLPNDILLQAKVKKLQVVLDEFPAEDDPNLIKKIVDLKTHLSETYRLHRRIVRNRRTRVQGITPQRKGGLVVESEDFQIAGIENHLERLRIVCADLFERVPSSARAFWECACCLVSAPQEMAERLKIVESLLKNRATKASMDSLRREVDRFDFELWVSNRIKAARSQIGEEIKQGKKIVVFCSTKSTAELAYEKLKELYGNAVIRHQSEWDEYSSLDARTSAFEFMNNPRISMIVCDQDAEEGLNLQGGDKSVLHFDIPSNTNRLEQRLGRVDRYGAGNQVHSIVLIDRDSLLQKSWLQLQKDAIKVFDRPVSMLQYLIEEVVDDLINQFRAEGVEAIIALSERLSGPSGLVEREIKELSHQDALDEMIVGDENDYDDLYEVDFDSLGLQKVIDDWVVQALRFKKQAEKVDQDKFALEIPFRYRYQPPRAGSVSTLLPLEGFIDQFLGGAIDFEHPESNSSHPLSFVHAFNRNVAVRNGLRLCRYGDEFVEAVTNFATNDDRGKAFFFERHIQENKFEDLPGLAFCFDYLIYLNPEPGNKVLQKLNLVNQTSEAAYSHLSDSFFKPMSIRIWIDDSMSLIRSPILIEMLESPFKTLEGAEDQDITHELFQRLSARSPNLFGGWDNVCSHARESAEKHLRDNVVLKSAIEDSLKAIEGERQVRLSRMNSRITLLKGAELEEETAHQKQQNELFRALLEGVKEPKITLDVAGAILLNAERID